MSKRKKLIAYPSGQGRDGEDHLSREETRLRIDAISFAVGATTVKMFPDKGELRIHGERGNLRLDQVLAELILAVSNLKTRVTEQNTKISGMENTIRSLTRKELPLPSEPVL